MAEKEIVTLIEKAETFEDTEKAAKVLYDYCVEQQEEQKKKVADIDSHQQLKTDLERPNLGEDDTEYEDEEKEESEGESQQSPQMEASTEIESSTDLSEFLDELEVKTAESLEDKLQDLINREGIDNVYVQIPEINLDTVIASNEDVHREINESFDAQQAAGLVGKSFPRNEGNQMRPIPGLVLGAPEIQVQPNRVKLADNNITSKSLLFFFIISKVDLPIDPVDPSIAIFFFIFPK